MDTSVLVPMLKGYLGRQDKLEYNKVFDNYYYYEFLELVKDNKDHFKPREFEKIVN
ncbi:Hypothetical protein BHY_1414 (plasmid) [Borrelia nietonii YOR]|uniref:Uncharacterized protein n=1 Tax=Borrelia nietonii YOR TaxID=1293576 RepID=W5SBU3_9SPIR|nr:hypothetical protein [Borrelia nietonii]AHH04365.1 Hypothetical protein BHY_1414 [Borrelia nietonii YOR]